MRPEHQLHCVWGGSEPSKRSFQGRGGVLAYDKAVAAGIFASGCVAFLVVGLLAAAASLGDLALDQLKQAHYFNRKLIFLNFLCYVERKNFANQHS